MAVTSMEHVRRPLAALAAPATPTAVAAPSPDRDETADGLLPTFLAAHDASCPTCDYNLRGLEKSTCPECGQALELGVRGHDVLGRRRGLYVIVLAWIIITGAANGVRVGQSIHATVTTPPPQIAYFAPFNTGAGLPGLSIDVDGRTITVSPDEMGDARATGAVRIRTGIGAPTAAPSRVDDVETEIIGLEASPSAPAGGTPAEEPSGASVVEAGAGAAVGPEAEEASGEAAGPAAAITANAFFAPPGGGAPARAPLPPTVLTSTRQPLFFTTGGNGTAASGWAGVRWWRWVEAAWWAVLFVAAGGCLATVLAHRRRPASARAGRIVFVVTCLGAFGCAAQQVVMLVVG